MITALRVSLFVYVNYVPDFITVSYTLYYISRLLLFIVTFFCILIFFRVESLVRLLDCSCRSIDAQYSHVSL